MQQAVKDGPKFIWNDQGYDYRINMDKWSELFNLGYYMIYLGPMAKGGVILAMSWHDNLSIFKAIDILEWKISKRTEPQFLLFLQYNSSPEGRNLKPVLLLARYTKMI